MAGLTGATRLLLPLCLLAASVQLAPAERIFYRGGLWLETSASVQRLSLHGVLEAWERIARSAEAGELSLRQREAVRLHECLTRRSHGELLERVAELSRAQPDRVYYSLSDFIAEGLKDLCPGP
ncbi:MAG: hypothetical protein HY726_07960 [Candidatus Rokubacteria bacterium]|nr:hypothetical protein [Candidatus Rokubacteria bacterium]